MFISFNLDISISISINFGITINASEMLQNGGLKRIKTKKATFSKIHIFPTFFNDF